MVIKYSDEQRDLLMSGVDELANVVKVTLGPHGRNVIIEQQGGNDPKVTKDGVTVAKSVSFEDEPIKNMGATLVKRVSEKSNEGAGDGTTTATVLAQAIMSNGIKKIRAGFNPVELKKGMDYACKNIVDRLNEMAVEVDVNNPNDLKSIATISANNDEKIGKLVADAFIAVGENGAVSVEEGSGQETTVEVVDGLQFNRGLLSHFFSSSQDKLEHTQRQPYILTVRGKINKVNQIIPVLELVNQDGRPLFIIAEDIEGQAMQALVLNRVNGGLDIAASKSPGFGDYREDLLFDIAAIVGAAVVDAEDLDKINATNYQSILGEAEVLTSTQTSTVIMGGKSNEEDLQSRINSIQQKKKGNITQYEQDKLREREAKLSGGVAVISVGGNSEVEMKELKDRIDDAKEACVSALEEGYVHGGGMALIRAALEVREDVREETNKRSESFKHGCQIVHDSVFEPFHTIVKNSGDNYTAHLVHILEDKNQNFGFDAKVGNYVDLYDAGIIDPKKVTRTAIEGAVSICGTMLTSEASITFKRRELA